MNTSRLIPPWMILCALSVLCLYTAAQPNKPPSPAAEPATARKAAEKKAAEDKAIAEKFAAWKAEPEGCPL